VEKAVETGTKHTNSQLSQTWLLVGDINKQTATNQVIPDVATVSERNE
jgi:hypothetical protein